MAKEQTDGGSEHKFLTPERIHGIRSFFIYIVAGLLTFLVVGLWVKNGLNAFSPYSH